MSTGYSGQGTARASSDRVTGRVRKGADAGMDVSAPGTSSWDDSEPRRRTDAGKAACDLGVLAYGISLDEQSMSDRGIDNISPGGKDSGDWGYEAVEHGRRKTSSGSTGLAMLLGAGLGATLMYVLDPQQGRRRRALLRDKITKTANDATDVIGRTSRDLRNRTRGFIAETRKMVDAGQRESGMPGGGQGRRDEVGGSGVYPVSHSEGASPDAPVHGLQSWGQGERGAAGYEDSGGSELIYRGEDIGILGGATEGESGAYKRPK